MAVGKSSRWIGNAPKDVFVTISSVFPSLIFSKATHPFTKEVCQIAKNHSIILP